MSLNLFERGNLVRLKSNPEVSGHVQLLSEKDGVWRYNIAGFMGRYFEEDLELVPPAVPASPKPKFKVGDAVLRLSRDEPFTVQEFTWMLHGGYEGWAYRIDNAVWVPEKNLKAYKAKKNSEEEPMAKATTKDQLIQRTLTQISTATTEMRIGILGEFYDVAQNHKDLEELGTKRMVTIHTLHGKVAETPTWKALDTAESFPLAVEWLRGYSVIADQLIEQQYLLMTEDEEFWLVQGGVVGVTGHDWTRYRYEKRLSEAQKAAKEAEEQLTRYDNEKDLDA